MVMGRGCRCGAACVGERWNDHTLNKGECAIQSASIRYQAPCLHAVTTLAWSRRRPNVAKPCLHSSPHNVWSRKVDSSCPGRPDLTLLSWQVSDQKLGRQVRQSSRRPLGLISWGLGFLRRVFKLKKDQGQKIKEKCTCCTKCISGLE